MRDSPPDPTSVPARRRLLAIALLVGIFAAGGVFGAAVQTIRQAEVGGTQLKLKWPDGLPPAFDELGLTGGQRTEVLRILARERPRTEAVMREVLPRLRAITDTVDAQIQQVLRPDQREKLARIRGARGPILLLKRPPSEEGVGRVDTVTSH